MGIKSYEKSMTITLAVLSLLLLTRIQVQAQGPSQAKAIPAIQMLLLSETSQPEIDPNIVFVTSVTYNGNLGGFAGADQKCQTLATAAGLPQNTYKAWLSTSSENAIDRLGSARGWVRVDGKPFADTKDDIVARKIFHPIRVDENGANVNDILKLLVWTGTQPDGTVTSTGQTCDGWTRSDTGAEGVSGSSDGVAAVFSQSNWSDCSKERRLYCFGVDKTAPVTVQPVSGRTAFVTRSTWTPSAGGLTEADSLCQSEATGASLTGTFKALLVTSTGSAQSRFEPITSESLPWVRPDGVAIAPTAAELFTSTFLNTAINQSADGLYYSSFEGVWGGAWDLTTAGTPETTCTNWTSTSGSVLMGFTSFTYRQKFFANAYGSCNMHLRFYCLQE